METRTKNIENVNNFPWSESGLHCLQNIQREISHHGGLETYTQAIIDELTDNHHRVDKFATKSALNIMVNRKLTVKEMSIIMRRPWDDVRRLLKYYDIPLQS